MIKQPTTLDEFGCWLNSWGNEDPDDQRELFVEGYREAISDAYRLFNKIHPSWMDAWNEYIKETSVNL